ncbi:efflux transporter outer membrane subunit [Kriegella sp. EG-1]|nr:efflux transporter outer membrane subunit [Flavobacteriaceae bacterium EG-1]
MFRNNKNYILCCLIVVITYACVPTRQVRGVKLETPESYTNQITDTLTSAVVKWKDFFTDPVLNELIEVALDKNQELNIVLQQIAIAKNEIRVQKGEYLPFVNFVVGTETEKVGEYTRNGAVEEHLEIDHKAFPDPLSNYSVGLYASWELDVWKKLRNSKKAAVMEYLATQEGKNFMVTNLVAEIAEAYYELIALDNQLVIIDENLEIQHSALQIVKLQKQAARTTELAVKRFEAEVYKNRSERFDIKQQIVETENKINFLIGRQPQTINRNSDVFIEKKVDTVFSGIPAQLIQYRPDIKQVEYELAAAKLDVKVARANFYPSFGINAGVGLEAFKPKFLTETPESLLYSLAGDMVGPLINRNAIKAEYNSANDRQLQVVFEYEKAILNAYMEVANELSNVQNLKMNYNLKIEQVNALNTSIDISNKLFQSARADYMEVLLTQRDALEAKIELVETKKNQLIARVGVYRAIGGGWN